MTVKTSAVRPSEYKARYETLNLTLEDGSKPPVTITHYRLRPDFFNPAGMTAFLAKLTANKIDMDLVVNTPIMTENISRVDANKGVGLPNWNTLARYAFLGKGSPEACQIVLQLASHWGIAPNLQQYADDYLGLDCNGFVGNYLWHTWGDLKDWKDLGVVEGQKGPDCGISGYLDPPRKFISKWEDIDTSKSYIFGRVGASGNVIDSKEAGEIAHIVITEPDERQDITLDDGSKTFAVKTVESTATNKPTPGLSYHWYKLRDPTKNHPANKIFEIDRGPDISGGPTHQFIKFKIVERDVTT